MPLYTSNGLPFLPGNCFRDTTKPSFRRTQTLSYKNGYVLHRPPATAFGQELLKSELRLQNVTEQLSAPKPQITNITYRDADTSLPGQFVPEYVAKDRKVLRFYGYFQEEVLHSAEERWRIRHVVVCYFLEDNSMSVVEPEVTNSGIPQGKRVRRHKVPKNQRGDTYHWKDLNLAMDLCVYGTTYRITHCDAFTQRFMESQGIILNKPESNPRDPYTSQRGQPQRSFTTPSEYDSLKQFLTMDRKVLRFYALWDDFHSPFGEKLSVVIKFYLVDDSVEIEEVRLRNSRRESSPLLLRRHRVPKHINTAGQPFASCIFEVSPREVEEYFSPRDFRVGEEVRLLGKRFLIYDCDEFTRKYYQEHYPDIPLKPLSLAKESQESVQRVIPPYNGFGSFEDSMQNCFSLIPEPPKKDLQKQLENDHKVLRYEARLDSKNPQDRDRCFIISYFLSDDMIGIYELPKHNSGFIGGKFLRKTRVLKPGSTMENPKYYKPADFAIGATVEVFRHRFLLINADQYVLDYFESLSESDPFSEQTLSSLRQLKEQNKKLDLKWDPKNPPNSTLDIVPQCNTNGFKDPHKTQTWQQNHCRK